MKHTENVSTCIGFVVLIIFGITILVSCMDNTAIDKIYIRKNTGPLTKKQKIITGMCLWGISMIGIIVAEEELLLPMLASRITPVVETFRETISSFLLPARILAWILYVSAAILSAGIFAIISMAIAAILAILLQTILLVILNKIFGSIKV